MIRNTEELHRRGLEIVRLTKYWLVTFAFFAALLPVSAEHDIKADASAAPSLESRVDLRKPSDNRRQTYYWLLDETGKQIKDLDYFSVEPYSEGLASVMDNRHSMNPFGYVDLNGNLSIPNQFANCREFSEGLAWVWTSSKANGYIDRQGNQVIKSKAYYEGRPFHEGLAAVRVRMSPTEIDDGRIDAEGLPGKWSYIDKVGSAAIAPRFDQARDFHQGLAGVKLRKEWMFIDHKGTMVGDKYQTVGSFADNLAPVQVGAKWGFAGRNGKIVLPAQFEEAREFSAGLAAVKTGGKYGFITTSGNIVIPTIYQAVDRFSGGLCAVQTVGGKWGFIDKEGKWPIPPTYDDAQEFSSGRALVVVQGKVGFIDLSGKYVVEPKFEHGFSYSDNRAVVSARNWNHPVMRMSLMSTHLKELNVHKDSSSPTGVYIPEDLADALQELDSMLPAAAKNDINAIDKSEMTLYHLGFGTWLRNNWGLWKGSRLADHFHSIGIQHPDDMSGTILDAYWAKLHGQPINVAEQAAQYKQFYDKLAPAVDVSVKLPEAIGSMPLSDPTGEKTNLSTVVHRASLTVVTLCTKSDLLSPKIIRAFDQLQRAYSIDKVSLIVVMAKGEVKGAELVIGQMVKSNMVTPDETSTDRLMNRETGCSRLIAPEALFDQLRELLKLDM